ncbi:MAG TPA: DUF4139 domain-containing protein [Kofleriaceae bacterium]|nr:DUF4139 domain-containing protein [Kofleriaceae bacterium]
MAAEPGREVTIYDGGAAVVVERRWVELRDGDNDVALALAVTAQPDSIAVRAHGGGAAVTERWMEAAAGDGLVGAVGKDVEVTRAEGAGAVRGRLVSVEGSVLVIDGGGGRVAVPVAEVASVGVAGAAPAARPVVHARVRADGAGRRLFELVYAAGGLGFGVSYELELTDAVTPRVRLRARASIHNRSGFDLGGAHVHLVAGSLDDPGHASLAFWTGRLELRGTAARDVDAVAMAPVAARYEAVYRGAVADAVNPGIEPHHGVGSQPVVARHLLVAVPRGGKLGAVLPAGPAVVTVASTAPAGDHVPRRVVTALAERVVAGEEARFPLGVEPALSGARRQVRVERAADLSRVTESYEIVVRNAGAAAARVRVVEPLSRSVRVTVDASEPRATHDLEARELVWIADVPPGGERKITYTATYRF